MIKNKLLAIALLAQVPAAQAAGVVIGHTSFGVDESRSAPTLNVIQSPPPSAVPAATNVDQQKYDAGLAFVNAWKEFHDSLSADISYDELLRVSQNCQDTRDKAQALGVGVDQWSCAIPPEKAAYYAGLDFTRAWKKFYDATHGGEGDTAELSKICSSSQDRARGFGVSVDQWSCALPAAEDVCKYSPPGGDVLFTQPALTDPWKCTFNNATAPSSQGKRGMIVMLLPANKDSFVPIHWPVGDFTGFRPAGDLAHAQWGVSDSDYGSYALQLENDQVGFQIHTESLGAARAANDIAGAIYMYDWEEDQRPRPFADPNAVLTYGIDVQIPKASADVVHSFAYADLYFIFRDTKSGNEFFYGAGIFDLGRGSTADTALFDDGHTDATGMPIVVTNISGESAIVKMMPGSEPQHTATWTGYKHFEMGISAANLKAAITKIKSALADHPKYAKYANLSNDPADYVVTHMNFDPEVANRNATHGNYGWLSVSFKNLEIKLRH